jgi:DNA-binding beta-propeller fold protein YncE
VNGPFVPHQRRRQPRRKRLTARLWLVGLAALGTAIIILLAFVNNGGGPNGSQPPSTTVPAQTKASSAAAQPRYRTVMVEHTNGRLPAPVQDAAGAASSGRAILSGGLTASDVSTAQVVATRGSSRTVIGALPSVRHDTAAVALRGKVYVFGGGNGISQLDEIVAIDPRSGSSQVVGHLPAASSDSSGAAIGNTAYIVGGYTGTIWLDSIVAWRPGSRAHIVARLPVPLRYAAVAAAGGRLIIAGGSLENATASRVIYEYTPGQRAAVQIGVLPGPTTHATAATLGPIVYVIGGRAAGLDALRSAIIAVDTHTRRITKVGSLRVPTSDLTAVTLGNRIVVAGGHTHLGTVSTLSELLLTKVRVSSRVGGSSVVNVYAHDGPNMLSPVARRAKPLIYVPNSQSNTVDEINPQTFTIVRRFAVGSLPQHIVPAWDLRTLYVTNDNGNSLTPINPDSGAPGKPIPVEDPYNMYFTPDGRHAIVVAERLQRLDFRNPHTFALQKSLHVPCLGVDHMDFSADGTYLIASCEFSGQLIKVDLGAERVVGTLTLPGGGGAMPQDVKLAPDGRIFYVADMHANGVWEINGATLKVIGFIHTGAGAHGLYPSRNARDLYVSNRSAGSISVISFATQHVIATWRIPGGGSPDMGGVSANGRVLWLSGRYDAVVYAINTQTGRLIAKIPVGQGPHGLCVWPQPGRYSLGHTGILR